MAPAVDERCMSWTLLFPPTCLGCGLLLRRAAPPSLPLCLHCTAEHEPLPPDATTRDEIWAMHAYGGPLLRALHRLKFHAQPAWAGPLGAVLACSPVLDQPWDAIVPIPLHRRRLGQRGYNQAALLARHARRHRTRPRPPLCPGWLRRVRATDAQHRLPAADRPGNVRGAFAVPSTAPVAGRRILLVDDVTTTGATLIAARDALRAAGAGPVGALALLRALA